MVTNKKIKTTESLQMRFVTEVKTLESNRVTNGPSIRSKEKNNFWINHLFGKLICGLSEKKVLSFSLERKERTKEKLEKALTLGILKRACGYTH